MRQKTYYTVDEITNNLYTTGSAWMNESGVEYIGLYHQYSTGETYTQPIWSYNNSVKLIKYENVKLDVATYKKLKSIRTTYENFVPYTVKLTAYDINNGFISRFFIQKINELRVIEIDSATFIKWQSKEIDPNIYVAVQLIWYISGTLTDETRDSVYMPSIITLNTNAIHTAKETIRNIDTALTNPLELYVDDTVVKPKDINGLDS